MKKTIAFLTATLLTCAVMSAPSVLADNLSASAPQNAVKSAFTDKQLQSFAKASQDITTISTTYNTRLQAAKNDATQQQQIRDDADQKMLQSIKDSGLTVDEFNEIGQAIQKDPELLKRVAAMVQMN